MLKRVVVGTALAAFLSVGISTAEGMKIAYVDMKSSLENTQSYQNGLKHWEALRIKKSKELEALGLKIQQAKKDILSQSMAMSSERLSQKQDELKDLAKAAARKQQDAQDELLAERNRLYEKAVSTFYKAVRNYGKKNGYDLILPKSNMIFASPSLDVTADITKILDKKE
ncbi:MAG: OmpH family outer membrane protein [Mariprofundaceae bacterium]|nr:OmpH family outer membrane protein [Mariprofundaceae bacterium]